MKRLVLTIAFLCCALTAGIAPRPVFAADMSALAPADRYFGHMKMSVLGIRNYLSDLSREADEHPEQAEHILPKVKWVDEAMHDWQSHFPRDPWIPKYAFALAKLYNKLSVDEAGTHVSATMDWLIANYPKSEYAQQEP